MFIKFNDSNMEGIFYERWKYEILDVTHELRGFTLWGGEKEEWEG